VSICEHEVDTLDGACLDSCTCRPAITLIGVLEDKCLGAGAEVIRIERAVVYAVEASETTHILHAPVGDGYCIDSLVEDTLDGCGEREGSRECIVQCDCRFPDLRHLELGIYCRDGRRNGSVIRRNCSRIAKAYEFVEKGLNGCVALGIGNEATSESIHGEAHLLCIRGVDLGLILNETSIGRHVGEEHQRETAGEETGTTADLQRLVSVDIPVETDARRNGNLGSRPHTGVDVGLLVIVGLRIIAESLDGIVGHKVAIIEEETVETEAVSEFEIIVHTPLVLSINAGFVELNPGSRSGLTIITVGEADDLGSSTAEEVGN